MLLHIFRLRLLIQDSANSVDRYPDAGPQAVVTGPHFVTTGTGLLSSTCYLPQAVSPALCACTCLKFYRAVDTIVYFCAVLQRGSHLHQDTASVCMNNGKCKQSHLPAPVLKLVFVSVMGTNSS